jgi:hypothetical protein
VTYFIYYYDSAGRAGFISFSVMWKCALTPIITFISHGLNGGSCWI